MDAKTPDASLGDGAGDAAPAGAVACAAIGGKCVPANSGCGTPATGDCTSGGIPAGSICCLDGVGNVCADGGEEVISASNYDQSCTKDSDCIAIATGNVCFPCIIECATGGAISAAAMSQYQADIEKTSAWATIQSTISSNDAHFLGCGCPFNFGPCCRAGMCQRGISCSTVALADAQAD